MGRRRFTARALPEFANTGVKGREAEALVASFFKDHGFILIEQNLKTPFAEVDLLFKKQSGEYLMVEVKRTEFAEEALSLKQAQRLERARAYLSTRLKSQIRMCLATVNHCEQIHVYPEVLAELVK